MVHYEIWFDLKNSHKDLEFCQKVESYLGHMRNNGLIETYTLRRRMLGFGPKELGEFNITIHLSDPAHLHLSFNHTATPGLYTLPLHAAVYSQVTNLTFGLARDFPDPVRVKQS